MKRRPLKESPRTGESARAKATGPGKTTTKPFSISSTRWTVGRVYGFTFTHPTVHNRLMGGNRKIHVKRYDTPFDVQDLMLEAGSGVYQFQATKQDPKTGKRPMFATGEVKILNVNHPPKIPVGEWVDDPRNKEWQWAKEAIMKQAIVAAPVAPPPPDPLIGILEKTIDRQEAAMQALRAEMTANAKAAADAAAAPKPDPAAGVMAILAPFLPAIIGKLTAPPPPPPDPMASLTAAITLLKSVTPPPARRPYKRRERPNRPRNPHRTHEEA